MVFIHAEFLNKTIHLRVIGRPRKLDDDDTLHLKDFLEEFPTASNEQLSAHLHNKLAPIFDQDDKIILDNIIHIDRMSDYRLLRDLSASTISLNKAVEGYVNKDSKFNGFIDSISSSFEHQTVQAIQQHVHDGEVLFSRDIKFNSDNDALDGIILGFHPDRKDPIIVLVEVKTTLAKDEADGAVANFRAFVRLLRRAGVDDWSNFDLNEKTVLNKVGRENLTRRVVFTIGANSYFARSAYKIVNAANEDYDEPIETWFFRITGNHWEFTDVENVVAPARRPVGM